jgi:hypothetical protein
VHYRIYKDRPTNALSAFVGLSLYKEAKFRAVRVVRIGEMGYLRASKYFSVPTGTLERYVKDTFLSPEELVNVHVGT